MQRTKFTNDHIEVNLIRRIAWDFHKSTRIEWNELFSEACLAYCESLRKYNPGKGSSITTWAYTAMRNALINFTKRETRIKSVIVDVETDSLSVEEAFLGLFNEELSPELSATTKFIILMVRDSADKYQQKGFGNKRVFGKIKKDLRKKGWSFPKIESAMRTLRFELIESATV